MKPPKHLFIIGPDILQAISDDEISAIVEDLKTLDLYHLPYDRVSARVPTDQCAIVGEQYIEDLKNDTAEFTIEAFAKFDRDKHFRIDEKGHCRPNLGPEHWLQYDNLNLLGEPVTGNFVCEGSYEWRPYCIPMEGPSLAHEPAITGLLIAVLATRNAVKSLTRHKLASLGIGGKRPGSSRAFEYVTTISVPSVEDTEDDHTVRHGASKVPHLRRGHIRHQHYGPGMSYAKMIWIAPVFVNADKDFVSTRKAYNLGGKRPH